MQSKSLSQTLNLSRPAVNNGLFAVLSLAGSALSYLLYPVLAKLITPVQFGDVSVVIALAGQISGLLLAFNVVSIYIVDTHEHEHALRITETIQKIVIQVLLAATALVMLGSPWLSHTLKIGSGWTLLGLGLLLLLNVPAVVWTGYLQGHNELARIGIYNLVVAAAKLAGAVILAVSGLGALGAIIGILLGQLVGLWVLRQVPGTQLPSARGALTRVTAAEAKVVRPLAGYVAESLTVVGVFSVLFAIDIVLAKAFFTPYLAGLYAGVAALGRIIFFGTAILTWIMLANLTTHDLKKSRTTLLHYLGLIAALGGVAVVFFWLAAPLIVRLSLGPAYDLLAPQLWLAGLNQLVAALLYAYTLYLLVLRRGRPAVLAILSCGLAIAGGMMGHGSPHQLLLGLIAGQVIGYAAYAVLVFGRNLTRRSHS
jgi:O-antigen/teichoic acid export membrane protein